MTKLQIISRMWSHIDDLLMLLEGKSGRSLQSIKDEIDITEYHCRRYADVDDDELYALDVLKTAEKIIAGVEPPRDGEGG